MSEITIRTLKEVMDYEQEGGMWLIDKLLPQNGIGILSGEAGTYKTWLLLTIAIAVASGVSLFEQFEVHRGAVLIIDEENRISLLKQRLSLMCAEEKLPIYFLVGQGVNLSNGDGWVDVIKFYIEKYNIKLITFDSLVRIHDGDENDARSVSKIFDKLKKLQKFATVLVTHHHRKEMANQANRPSQALRGSSDLRAAVDTHLAVYSKNKGEIKVYQSKARDAEVIDPFVLKLIESDGKIGFVYTGEAQGSAKVEAKKAIIKLLKETEELSRTEVVEGVKDVAGGTAIGQALKELENEKFISVRNEAANKKFYSLVKPD